MRRIVSMMLLLAMLLSFVSGFGTVAKAAEDEHTPIPFAYSNAALQTEPVSLSGYTYNDAIKFSMGYTGISNGSHGQVTYNLKGRYEELSFEAGFYEGDKRDAKMTVFADGAEIYSNTVLYGSIVRSHTIPVKDVKKLVILFTSEGYDKTHYVIGNLKFTPDTAVATDPVRVSDEFYDICRYQQQNASVLEGDFSMGGYDYQNGYKMTMGYTGYSTGSTSKVFFNFKGSYKQLSFDIAKFMNRTNEQYTRSATLTIELDGVVLEGYDHRTMNWDDPVLSVTVDLEGVHQVMIQTVSSGYDKVHWALGNIQLISDGRAHGILLAADKATLTTDKPNFDLNPRVYPSDAVNKNFTLSIDPQNVAILKDDHIAYGFNKGTAVVTATTEDGGHTATCKLTSKLPEAKDVYRIYGSDRYATAFKAADELKTILDIEKFDNIIVASGTGFADALAGSYLAAQKKAPILLVRGANVNDVKNYIKANLASGGTVYLLGGVSAVPKAMETGLDGFNVKRLGGANRYDTNLLILQEAGIGSKDIIVCTGLNFADSLSASATGLPILLVKDGLYANQKEFLKGAKGDFVIIGGTNAVPELVENQLKDFGSVERLAGNTRYESSVLVAEKFFRKPANAVLAYAQNFPDGLSGGPLAYALKAPLILTASGKQGAAVGYTTEKKIREGYVLGGTGLINDASVRVVFDMDPNNIIWAK